ncbi:MAG TPA: protein kinase [Gemmatimonadaceae bacterium]|nr:protein kinase [Gemmatimonadaceae bacterium]
MTDAAARLSSALSDRYRIDRELGAGGMATVYLAHDLKHDRKVAIKVLHPDLAAALGAQRFLSEIKTTANLQHPHILPLHDSGEADGLLFYVMPFVEGESLRDRLDREKPLPIDDAVGIAREVADALDYAHRHGVIHRDIKPENILLHDRRALVADFGIALAVQSAGGERMTQTGLSLGTPHYMSPEQAMGEKQIDARSDVYALGAVLYEMLTGDPPFTGSTVQAIVAKVMSAEPEPVTMLRRNTPPAVAGAVHRALEKLPADRFPSARAFADALVASAPTASAAPGGARLSAWRRAFREPLTLTLAAVTVAAIAMTVWERGSASAAAPAQVERFVVDPQAGVHPDIGLQSTQNVAIAPDGSLMVFAAIGSDGMERLYARRADELDARPIEGTEGGSQPFFSPDGQLVAFWVAGRLLKINVGGGPPSLITDLRDMTGATWTTGGEIVASVGNRLVWFPVRDPSQRRTASLDTAHHEALQMFPVATPDGEHVLYSSWGTGGLEQVRLGELSLNTGRSRRLDIPGRSALGMLDGKLVFSNETGGIAAAPFDPGRGTITGALVPLVSNVANGQRFVAIASLSATGTLFYVTGTAQSTLVLADSAGDTPVIAESREYAYPRYSPDGKQIAIVISAGATRDVWLYDVATRGLRRLTNGGSVNERPEWSPDGKRVLFRSDRSGQTAIWWQPIDESAPATMLVGDPRLPPYEGVMMPDGRGIVYQADTTRADIYYRAITGDTTPQPIATSPADESEPRPSPDGHWIAFQASESGTSQVVVQAFPGTGPRIPISTGGGEEPVWARDGRHLFYRGHGQFVVVTFATTPSFHVIAQHDVMPDSYLLTVAPHANYDVSPDGRKLLVLKGGRQQLVVVRDWWTEVRRQLARKSNQ